MAGSADASRPIPIRRAGPFFSILRGVSGVAGFFAILAAVAFLVILPVWYLAVRETALYTIGFAVLAAGLAILFFVFRWRRAVRENRLDVFTRKILRLAAFLVLLIGQGIFAGLHIVFYEYLKGGAATALGTVLFALLGGAATTGSLLLIWAAGRLNLTRRSWRIVALVLYSTQAVYWLAVFFYQGFALYACLMLAAILGCSFSPENYENNKGQEKPAL